MKLFIFNREEDNALNFKDAVNYGIKLAVEQNNPLVKLMPVGKLRKFERIYEYDRHPLKQSKANFRVNAVKSEDGIWREWPTGLNLKLTFLLKFIHRIGYQTKQTLLLLF